MTVVPNAVFLKSEEERFVEAYDDLVAANRGGYGTVAALFESPRPGEHVPCLRAKVVRGKGFAGDHPKKSFWRGVLVPGREVSACAVEMLDSLNVDPALGGDNLITKGVDLRTLRPGQRVSVGTVTLVRSECEHRPCSTFRDRTSELAFRVAARGYRGALFVVEKGGTLCVGDRLELLPSGRHPESQTC